MQNFDIELFSNKTGSFLSREEDNFSMHTKQGKVFSMNHYPEIFYSYVFYKNPFSLDPIKGVPFTQIFTVL